MAFTLSSTSALLARPQRAARRCTARRAVATRAAVAPSKDAKAFAAAAGLDYSEAMFGFKPLPEVCGPLCLALLPGTCPHAYSVAAY